MHSGLSPEKRAENEAVDRKNRRRALRERLLAAREALSPELCERFSAQIRVHLQHAFPEIASRRVAFCWPIRNEPDLRPLIAGWLAEGKPGFMALLPVVNGPAQALAFRAWRPGCPMQEDRFGIPSPTEGTLAEPEVLLIPVNAFDANGYRLGYGGGFFDRTLAELQPSPMAIGVGYELARVDSIFPEAHDIRLDAVVTEAGVCRTDFR